MQNFKQFLLQENVNTYPWQVQTNEELLKLPGWREDIEDGKKILSFVDDNTGELYLQGTMINGFFEILGDWLYFDKSILVEYSGEKYLPFNIKKWVNKMNKGNLTLENLTMGSLAGFPETINGAFTIDDCQIKSVEGCPSIIKGSIFNWVNMPITNKINKTVKYVGHHIVLPTMYIGFLSFLLIEHVDKVFLTGSYNYTYEDKDNKRLAIKIINNYIASKNNDILECQEELITNGLKQYAKL